jgi:ribonuclease-3
MDIIKKYNLDLKNDLYIRAFTHSSYSNETKKNEDYERLEFLGDKILDFIVSEYLYINEHLSEGEMTRLRASYVCENALYEYSNKLEFYKYLRLGKGEENTGGRHKKAILADVFEAFLAATYLLYGIDVVKNIVNDVVIPYIENEDNIFLNDYKSKLQEYVQTDKKSLEYEVINEEGPANNKVFTVVVKVDNIVFGKGTANSKKEAEQEAAKDALEKSKY